MKCCSILTCGVLLLRLSSSFAEPEYLSQVSSEADFISITAPVSFWPGILRATKFTAPISDDPSLLQTVYQNLNEYEMHFDFLIEVFPERFVGLTIEEYEALVLKRATREYFSGAIFSIGQDNSQVAYGFEVAVDPMEDSELLTAEETRAVYNRLAPSFALRPFVYAPNDPRAIDVARNWVDPGFPILFPGMHIEPAYEAYTLGVNYGRVRRMTLEQLASGENAVSWQDILVLDRAPFELDTVIAALITGERQTELSHVAIRMARRGTPNAYLENPHVALAAYEGQLVRIEFKQDSYTIDVDVLGDESDEFEPWLEFVNCTTSEIVLDYGSLGYQLDSSQAWVSWRIPRRTALEPNARMVLWLDGEPDEGPLHTTYRPDPQKGTFLLDVGGMFPSCLYYYENPPPGKSEGRLPDGTGQYCVLDVPTPGEPNSGSTAIKDWGQY